MLLPYILLLVFIWIPLGTTIAIETLPEPLASAEAALKKGHADSALKIITTFLSSTQSGPLVPRALLAKGNCFVALGKEQDALESWSTLVTKFGASQEAPIAIAQSIELYTASRTRRNPVKIRELTQSLLGSYPKSPSALPYAVAEANDLFGRKRYADFIRIMSPLSESLKPGDKDRLRFAEVMVAGLFDCESILKQASRSFEENEVALAVKLYEEALSSFPSSPRIAEIKTKLGWCLYTRNSGKDQDAAEGLWRQVAALKTRDIWVGEARWHIVQLLAGPKGRYKEAAEMCVPLAKEFVGTPLEERALFARAWILWSVKEYKMAALAFDDLLLAFPDKASHPSIAFYINDCKEKVQSPTR